VAFVPVSDGKCVCVCACVCVCVTPLPDEEIENSQGMSGDLRARRRHCASEASTVDMHWAGEGESEEKEGLILIQRTVEYTLYDECPTPSAPCRESPTL
jgi:hypothetical protein